MSVESTPLYDATVAGDPLPVDNPVDPTPTDPPAPTDPTPAPPDLPPGPDLDALQAFTAAIPDEGHRAIAQHLVDAFTARDTQLQAFIALYTTAMSDVTGLRADVTVLQEQVAALQPAPTPDPTPIPDPVPAPTTP